MTSVDAEESRVAVRPTVYETTALPPSRNTPSQTASASLEREPEAGAPATTNPNTTVSHPPPQPLPPEPNPPRDMATTVSEPLCEGDTTVITNVLPPDLAASAFERLLDEVSWAGMSHMGGEVPRRIAVQGAVGEDGSMPVYRHPADESPPLLPFSPTVLRIKAEVEKHLGHPVNHVLIQHYRSGNDYISEHSDKTLDIVRGSFIANVSLGAERTMVFRTKRPPRGAANTDTETDAEKAASKRQVQRAPLPHNSLLRMGLATNERWLHSIRQDRRAERDKTAAERSHGGARISLTFRQIGTFIDAAQARIWGQGATGKTRADARPVVNGQTDEAVRLLHAFGAENHASAFDWAAHYGAGSDVLHMGTPKRFFAAHGRAADAVANARVALALAELGVSCARGSLDSAGADDVRFEDNDPGRAVVRGHAAVLRYLDAVYGPGRRYDQMPAADVARRFVLLQDALDLLPAWRRAQREAANDTPEVARLLARELAEWDRHAREAGAGAAGGGGGGGGGGGLSIAGGSQPSPADFALWPVLHDMVRVCGEEAVLGGHEHLMRYYAAFRERSAVAKVLGMFNKGEAIREEL